MLMPPPLPTCCRPVQPDGAVNVTSAAADAVGLLLGTARTQGATLVIATHDARAAPLIPAGPEGHAGYASLRLTRPAPLGATA